MNARLTYVFVLFGLILSGMSGCQHLTTRDKAGIVASYSGNPRYFADARGRPLLLIGDYTWGMFSDVGYDYNVMLDEIAGHGQNFARVWLWWGSETFPAPHNKSHIVPYMRTGPGIANDGQPKYNLNQFNPAFFQRLQQVCHAAEKRGIVLQFILFDAWMIKHEYLWRLHAYCRDNNVNDVDGDPKQSGKGTDGKRGFCSMGNPPVLEKQEAYIRHVLDAVSPFNNILFEIANENFYSKDWERHLCEFIHEYEKDKQRKHLVMPLDLPNHGYGHIQTYDIRKMHTQILKAFSMRQPIVFDTDGLGYPDDATVRKAMWTAFVSGANTDYLDDSLQPDGKHHGDFRGRSRGPLRDQLGYLAAFAHKTRFGEMKPEDTMLTSGFGFVFASAREVVAYVPEGGTVTLNLPAQTSFAAKWYDPRSGEFLRAPIERSGSERTVHAPSGEDWVLWVRSR